MKIGSANEGMRIDSVKEGARIGNLVPDHRDHQAMMQNLIVFWHIMVTAPSPEMSLL